MNLTKTSGGVPCAGNCSRMIVTATGYCHVCRKRKCTYCIKEFIPSKLNSSSCQKCKNKKKLIEMKNDSAFQW